MAPSRLKHTFKSIAERLSTHQVSKGGMAQNRAAA